MSCARDKESVMTCIDAEPLIARYADDESSLPSGVRGALVAHFAGCARCRAVLDEQREVAALLRGRLPVNPKPGLPARVSARIDREDGAETGDAETWLGLANWRRWTVTLAPLAAALVVAAYIDLGSTRSSSTSTDTTSIAAATTLEDWTTADAPPAVQSSTVDELIETVLTGRAPSSGDTDVR
jgi:predicted anti-sigma-YlaC factor YlaD